MFYYSFNPKPNRTNKMNTEKYWVNGKTYDTYAEAKKASQVPNHYELPIFTISPENTMKTEKLYVVIDNDTKEAVSVSVKKTAAERWADEFNESCHLCGGSSTQYGISEAEN